MTIGETIPLAVLAAAALACDGQQPVVCVPADLTPPECVEMLGIVASPDAVGACHTLLALSVQVNDLTTHVNALCAASPGVCP